MLPNFFFHRYAQPGLDNVTSEGASAFDTLEKVVETMTSLSILNVQPVC